MRVYNFAAGPSTLPLNVLEKVQKEFLNFSGTGMSVCEISHRDKAYEAVVIEVVIQPESIIHSMVSFADGSVKAQLGVPDMKLPIQYALSYPFRPALNTPRLNFAELGSLHFEKPDTDTFMCLALAYRAIEKGGNMPCIMNAANEIAVEAFLAEKISFLQIGRLIEKAMETVTFSAEIQLKTLEETDAATRDFCRRTVASGISL